MGAGRFRAEERPPKCRRTEYSTRQLPGYGSARTYMAHGYIPCDKICSVATYPAAW